MRGRARGARLQGMAGRVLHLPGRAGHDAASAPPSRRPGKPGRAAPARKGDLGVVTAPRRAVGAAGGNRLGAGKAALGVFAAVSRVCQADPKPRVLGTVPPTPPAAPWIHLRRLKMVLPRPARGVRAHGLGEVRGQSSQMTR